jgi:hypothetical protein
MSLPAAALTCGPW